MRKLGFQETSKRNTASGKLLPQSSPIGRKAASSQLHTSILDLQHTHGNRFVQQLLSRIEPQRERDCGASLGSQEFADFRNNQSSLQRESIGQSDSFSVPGVVREVLGSGGRELDAGDRGFMESRFGENFARVRVHTDTRAAESARAVSATAYTVGRNIVFADGKYAPGTTEGRRLLAHELTHTLQQADGPAQDITGMSEPGDLYEREAEQIASRVMRIKDDFDTPTPPKVLRSPAEPLDGAGGVLSASRFGDEVRQVPGQNIAPQRVPANLTFGPAGYRYDPEAVHSAGTRSGRRVPARELENVLPHRGIAQRQIIMRNPDFDEKKMFEIARKSKRVVELEKQAKELGFSYACQVSGEGSYTDPVGKKIYIKKELTNEQAALAYAYELQNAINVSVKYKAIYDKAAKGQIKDAAEYATAMISVEVEALITEAQVSIELGMESWKKIRDLVEKHNKGEIKLEELKKSVFKLAEAGVIDGMSARKYYEKQYTDKYKK